VPSIIANATSTFAIMPGVVASAWAYREDFRRSPDFPFVPMVIVSLAGGVAGALLLLFTPQKRFDSIIPWLMLVATLLFTFGPRISPILKRAFHVGPVTVVVVQFFIAVYGGYFGGAIGILMLATWSVFGINDINFMNANRTLLGGVANSMAVVLFIVARKIWWPQALTMLAATVIGGYIGARTAKKLDPRFMRAAISATSIAITVAFFLRRF
jgi:uncharacterized membrane protein YfcA